MNVGGLQRYGSSLHATTLVRAALVAIFAAHILVILAALFPGRSHVALRPGKMAAEQGFAYVASLAFKRSLFFDVASDGPGSSASRLVVTENGRSLGPGHASHSAVRGQGRGAYSHWQGQLWFSTSDGSDPRSNGRIYWAEARRELKPAIWAGLAVADLIAIWFARRSLAATFRQLAARASARALGALGLVALAAPAIALLPALVRLAEPVGRNDGSSAAAHFAALVLGHAALGLLLAGCVWFSGMGAAVMLLGRRAACAPVLALGFPLGSLLVGAASSLALIAPAGLAPMAVLGLAPALALPAWRPGAGGRRAIAALACHTAGFGFALAILFGMAWHGPLAGSPSTLSGDMNFFSASIVNLSGSPFPFRNLGSEGEFFVHLGSLVLLIGAALYRIGPLDPSLFLSASVAGFYVISVALAIAGFVRVRGRFDPLGIGIVALGAVAAGRYPSWITESPAVALSVPFGISILTMTLVPGGPVVNRILPLLIAFPATIVSKAAAGLVYSTVAMSGALGAVRQLPRPLLAVLAAIGAGLALLGTILIAKFWAFMVTAQGIGPESRDLLMRWNASLLAVWPYALRDLAVLPLSAGLLRSQPWALAAALVASLFVGIIFNTFLIINFVVVVVLAALLMGGAPTARRHDRWLSGVAIAMCIPAMLLTDPAGFETGIPWMWPVALAGAAVLACSAGSKRSWLARAAATASWTAVSAALVGLLAFATGTYRPLPAIHAAPGPITFDVADIWAAVRERTPPDALIFTDQTSAEPTVLGGWNTVSATGGRQVFLSNYYQSNELRNDPARRNAKLEINWRVLAGELAPTQVQLSRRYSANFAVVANAAPVPPYFWLIYRNERWSLYGIDSK